MILHLHCPLDPYYGPTLKQANCDIRIFMVMVHNNGSNSVAVAEMRAPHLHHHAVPLTEKLHTPIETPTLTARWAEMHRFIRQSAPQTVRFQNKVLWHSALCNYTMMDSTTLIMEPLCATDSPGWICPHSLTGEAQTHYKH